MIKDAQCGILARGPAEKHTFPVEFIYFPNSIHWYVQSIREYMLSVFFPVFGGLLRQESPIKTRWNQVLPSKITHQRPRNVARTEAKNRRDKWGVSTGPVWGKRVEVKLEPPGMYENFFLGYLDTVTGFCLFKMEWVISKMFWKWSLMWLFKRIETTTQDGALCSCVCTLKHFFWTHTHTTRIPIF